ncbi:hypothetical protein TNCV_948011 [Trichonephila clavipes]|nr:hypothetical protein TNCV_948011 [Trichonephila clavipes]
MTFINATVQFLSHSTQRGTIHVTHGTCYSFRSRPCYPENLDLYRRPKFSYPISTAFLKLWGASPLGEEDNRRTTRSSRGPLVCSTEERSEDCADPGSVEERKRQPLQRLADLRSFRDLSAEDLQAPWHWRNEIYKQKIWLSTAYPGPSRRLSPESPPQAPNG